MVARLDEVMEAVVVKAVALSDGDVAGKGDAFRHACACSRCELGLDVVVVLRVKGDAGFFRTGSDGRRERQGAGFQGGLGAG